MYTTSGAFFECVVINSKQSPHRSPSDPQWHDRHAAAAVLGTELPLSCIRLCNAISLAFFVRILTLCIQLNSDQHRQAKQISKLLEKRQGREEEMG